MEHSCLKEFVTTGPLLGPMKQYSAALPVCADWEAIARQASGTSIAAPFLRRYYMQHKIARYAISRDGSTYRAEDTDFLSTDSHDVRLTDVKEDADGSLLFVDALSLRRHSQLRHAWATPGLPRLENMLRKFPSLPLIGHAAGFWASVSGDATPADFGRYPKIPTPVTPGGALDRLMERYKDLYGDLSEPGGYSAIARDREFGRQFLIRRADQLLFGTDFLMPDQEIPHFALYDSLDLPDDVQQTLFPWQRHPTA